MEKIIEREESIVGKMAKDAIEIVRRLEARNPLQLLFLTKVMTELSRCYYLFEAVGVLSLMMHKNVGKHKDTKQWVTSATTFLIYSYVDEFRCILKWRSRTSQPPRIPEKDSTNYLDVFAQTATI
ncbi:predicted protein [Chaetoceros tenuissimus]|uniref:Uncharacterized protein n=1 Tax=Chaetoceros tenuissimus TaxID=426638 RepID=A0AAD3DAL1_9STRA|nr:predicted protein [Chaetoceros tenuissimus]